MARISKPLKPSAVKPLRFIGEDSGLTLYLREISKTKNLSMVEEAELTSRIRQGDRKALAKLVSANLKFVVSVCRNYQNQGLPMTDLISEGNLGLIRAAKRFDETKKFKFISYAVWWVRQAILQSLAEQSRTLNIPLNRVTAIHRIAKSSAKVEQKLGRSISMSELSLHISVSEAEIQECHQLSTASLSLESPFHSGDESGSLGDVLKDENVESPDKFSLRTSLCKEVAGVLGTLENREEEVLKLYFGIGMDVDFTLDEIGHKYNLTRERVRQIKEKALKKLKHCTRSNRLGALRH